MKTKLLNKLVTAAAITLPMLTLGANKALASDFYGAIAYSPSTRSHGYSYDYSTQQAAQNRALRECESYSGKGDCRILVWFKNACGALAQADNGAAGSGWGVTQALAESYALRSCREYGGQGCKISRWVCTSR
ncbi:MAG: DUF4189 domain-containing protein [Cyanobacteria bacterium J083]|nr:MAG: DUF4189 domain-containing protein [Cyanobacteria bacterium J083]